VPRDELAEVVWGENFPATWEKALRVLITKLRALLEECGIDRSAGLTSAFGCYKLTLPADTWIDIHEAESALERGEAAFAAGDLEGARAEASAATVLSRRTFLPGEDRPWVEEQRRHLRDVLVRALECLRDASLAAGEFGDAARHAAEIIELEPFRESSYRALMQAHAGAGNPAEALRVYERCRRFLADELGAYPSAESEAVYLEILRNSSGTSAEIDRVEDAPIDEPPPNDEPPRRGRRRVAALVTATVLVAVATVAAGLAFASRDKHPLVIRPNSLVRLDPETREPKQVIPIGPKADQIAAAGGYVWVLHASIHHGAAFGATGDRTLSRVDPSTGKERPVGDGLAPCGITPDPTGGVWVANCYGSAAVDMVVRINARTLKFEKTRWVPAGAGYYRGIVWGGGSLWVADPSFAKGEFGATVEGRRLTQLDPRNPAAPRGSIQLHRHATALAWSDASGDLWMTNFNDGSVTRRHVETERTKTFEDVASGPGSVVVQDDAVWVADWDVPRVVRLPAVGSGPPRSISLPVTQPLPTGVVQLAADSSGVWAALPDDHAVWRIDPRNNHPRRVGLTYEPWGVAVGDDGIWVALRGR
jgi:DNA-binding SARP family transcriptional activator/streptogramin lyase